MLIKYIFYAFMLTPGAMVLLMGLFPESSKEIFEWGFVFGIALSIGVMLPFMGRDYHDD